MAIRSKSGAFADENTRSAELQQRQRVAAARGRI
jgi:hypothetical protein